ncbi:MAG: hypothetical protein U5K29_10485 [Acidimicrobiales bacterium]|nr:hypothetical protein [Acidimicrobiales bacterium]
MQLLERDLTRRMLFAGLLALAVAGMVIAVSNGRTSPNAAADRSDAVDALVPDEGADVLRQSTVGIDVGTGYQARLVINGTTVPDDQLAGDQGLGQYFFTPGPGQVLESLHGGQNCIIATYWLAAEGPEQGQTTRWCFSAA